MAKPWSQVEASPAYQALNPDQQTQAKQQYFQQVVAVKPEFQSLPDVSKQAAQAQFLGQAVQNIGAVGRSENQLPPQSQVPNIAQLPGYANVQAKLAERGSQFQPLQEMAQKPLQNLMALIGNPVNQSKLAMQGMGAIGKTIEQPIANAGMAIQEGRFRDIPKEIGQGITGQRPGELGDIYRNVGVPEPLAALGGLLVSTAIVPGAPQKGQKAIVDATKTGTNLAKDAVNAVRTPSGSGLDLFIDKNIEKAIRPSFSGKTTPALFKRFKGQARQAVKTIVQNKDILDIQNEFGESTGKLPENLQQFSQAIDQVKKKIFDQYSGMAQKAGESGASVDLTSIADDIMAQVNTKSVKTLFPELVTRTEKIAENLRKSGTFTPKEAQEAIEMMNASLKAFYKNPNPQAAANVVVDAAIASQLRIGLDKAVDGLGGAYQGLKNEFGALRAIQDDVMKRALVDARKNNKGLADLGDIFAKGDIVNGLLSMQPGMLAGGVAKQTLFSYVKKLNDPNRMVKNMFNVVERASKRAANRIGYE